MTVSGNRLLSDVPVLSGLSAGNNLSLFLVSWCRNIPRRRAVQCMKVHSMRMAGHLKQILWGLAGTIGVTTLAGCGGSSGSHPPTYTVGVTVSGLSGSGL